jgi:hypothetical protein
MRHPVRSLSPKVLGINPYPLTAPLSVIEEQSVTVLQAVVDTLPTDSSHEIITYTLHKRSSGLGVRFFLPILYVLFKSVNKSS